MYFIILGWQTHCHVAIWIKLFSLMWVTIWINHIMPLVCQYCDVFTVSFEIKSFINLMDYVIKKLICNPVKSHISYKTIGPLSKCYLWMSIFENISRDYFYPWIYLWLSRAKMEGCSDISRRRCHNITRPIISPAYLNANIFLRTYVRFFLCTIVA